jgi:radical SAM superfamily enzyme YgiQ (UPF0313 family)
LINPPSFCVEEDRVEPPLGLLYIAAELLRRGWADVRLCDLTGCKSKEQIAAKIDDIPQADVYGLSCLCTNYAYAKRIIRSIKSAHPPAYVAVGGPNPSAIPEFTLRDSGADVVIVGEGEIAFADCVHLYRSGAPVHGIVQGQVYEDIDRYPFPARDLVDLTTYSRRLMGRPVVSMLSSRGCKYKCIHCNSVVMGGGAGGARYRSAESILAELGSLRDRFRFFRFNDDHFTGNPNLEKLLVKMRDLDIRFRAFARIEDLDERTCRLLAEAGCVHVSIGLESLNPENLRALGKAQQIAKETNVAIAKLNGLVVRASFMVGLPCDTDETIEAYFLKASRLGIDEFAVYPLIPYPGTRIWENPQRFGYAITDRDFTRYVQIGRQGASSFALRHTNFGPEDVKRWKSVAERLLETNGARHMRESDIAR